MTKSPDVLTVGNPADVLATVPYLCGFRPENSLVVLCLAGSRRRLIRLQHVDLPPRELVDPVARALAFNARAARADSAIIVGYAEAGIGPEPPRVPLLDAAHRAFERPRRGSRPLRVFEALCVAGGRWWSAVCTDESCCPAVGHPVESDGRVEAEATVRGLVVGASRSTPSSSLAPVTGRAAASMWHTLDQALAEWTEPVPAGHFGVRRRAALIGLEQLMGRWAAGDCVLDDGAAARVLVALTDVEVRDTVITDLRADQLDTARALWTAMVRHAVSPYGPAAATVLATVAWEQGDPVLAAAACERALADDPEYRLALQIRTALSHGLPAGQMRALRSRAGRR
jgi:hypothetical protein